MKRMKFYVASICLCFLLSCSNENVINTEAPTPMVSSVRSLEEVLAIAENSLNILEEGTTRADNSACRKIDMQNIKVVGKNGTRSASQGAESSSLLYIVNFNDSMGYAIVSANRNTEGLIAVTENGSCDPNCIENPGLQYYMDCARKYVEDAPSTYHPTSDTLILITTRLPLIDTQWKQKGTWGAYCPNGICGCGPLALFEIMGYHKYPENIELSYLGASSYSISLNWDDMMLHKKDRLTTRFNPCCAASTSSHQAIGLLAREIGHRSYAIYMSSATSVYFEDLHYAALQMGYSSNGIRSYAPECTITPLDNRHPLLVCGYTTADGGHAWVVDGYRKELWTIADYDLADIGYTNIPVRTETYLYNHINWGWDGSDNGYFSDGVFAPSNYHSLDPGSTYIDVDYNFSKLLQYIELYPSDN